MNRIRRGLVAAAATAALIVGMAPAQANETPLPAGQVRLQGANRYATSAEISSRSFSAPVAAAFVATGESFPDALAGGPIAARLGGPVLLVGKNSVSDAVRQELLRLAPEQIYVLGGTGVISSAVLVELRGYTTGGVQRVSGANRYATASAASKLGWASSSTVFLSSGAAFADALGGGAAAAQRNAPLLLTAPNQLSTETRTELRRLAPTRVYVLGGAAAISGGVVTSVKEALPGVTVTRLSGADRYATSARIAEAIWPQGANAMFFATGASFPDALSGTPAAHVNSAPLVLSKRTCMTAEVMSVRDRFGPTTRALLGGTAALANGAIDKECGANRYTGVGDDVIAISKPGGSTKPALVTATHDGSGHFAIVGLDANLEWLDLLVNVIGPYSGTTMLDDYIFVPETSRHLEISANGHWTVTVKSLSAARALTSSTSGQGDEVLSWTGAARTATFTHQGTSNFIVVAYTSTGEWHDLLVNKIGNYTGTVAIPAGTRYLTVEADGNWTVQLR